MAILSRLAARGGGKWESASISSSATVGSLKKNWNFDVNCEKLVFLVFNIAKHIFLAVLYSLAAGSKKAAQMHSDPVNSLHVVICGKN